MKRYESKLQESSYITIHRDFKTDIKKLVEKIIKKHNLSGEEAVNQLFDYFNNVNYNRDLK